MASLIYSCPLRPGVQWLYLSSFGASLCASHSGPHSVPSLHSHTWITLCGRDVTAFLILDTGQGCLAGRRSGHPRNPLKGEKHQCELGCPGGGKKLWFLIEKMWDLGGREGNANTFLPHSESKWHKCVYKWGIVVSYEHSLKKGNKATDKNLSKNPHPER